MKSILGTAPALCIALFVAPVGCGGAAVQSYIDIAKTSSKLPDELEPPPCVHGESGKNAIIQAFRESGSNPPGVLPLATFVSLSCYRVKQVEKAVGHIGTSAVFKANIPVDQDMLETMIAAWNSTSDKNMHEEMNGQFLFLDHQLLFQLYATIQEGDKPLQPGDIHPKGAFFPIDGASKEETEGVRQAWCQYVAPGAYKRFFDDKTPLDTDGALIRDTEMAGLIGNQCTETDQMLTELIKRVDTNAQIEEEKWASKEGNSRGGALTTSQIILGKDAIGYPLISHLGKDIAGQGVADPNRTKHYLEMLAQSGHSCAFGADIKRGLQAALSAHPELETSVGAHITAYKEFLRKTCGDML